MSQPHGGVDLGATSRANLGRTSSPLLRWPLRTLSALNSPAHLVDLIFQTEA
jgi:hypothetical protein